MAETDSEKALQYRRQAEALRKIASEMQSYGESESRARPRVRGGAGPFPARFRALAQPISARVARWTGTLSSKLAD